VENPVGRITRVGSQATKEESDRTGRETPLELRTMYGAYHEAGHFVVAAVRGLTLRPDGLMVISNGDGLSVYNTQPDESDASRESIIVSSFAGYWASKRFCDEHSCPDLLDTMAVTSPDWVDARTIVLKLSAEYLADDNILKVQQRLEKESKRLVDQYWSVVEALAIALLAKKPEPMRPLKTGHPWSNHTGTVRYMDGEEAVEILAQHGITAVCKPRAGDS
jgi:hypothetical protein